MQWNVSCFLGFFMTEKKKSQTPKVSSPALEGNCYTHGSAAWEASLQPLPSAGGQRDPQGDRGTRSVCPALASPPNSRRTPASARATPGSSVTPCTSASSTGRRWVKERRDVQLHSVLQTPVRGWCLIPSLFDPEPVVWLVLSCSGGLAGSSVQLICVKMGCWDLLTTSGQKVWAP